jgi:hypothetical protein
MRLIVDITMARDFLSAEQVTAFVRSAILKDSSFDYTVSEISVRPDDEVTQRPDPALEKANELRIREWKRFELAKAVLQGLYANAKTWDWDYDKLAGYAISQADVMLNELDKPMEVT